MPFTLEMLSSDIKGGAKIMDSFPDEEWAEEAAGRLADWMSRKGIRGSVRVLCDDEIVHTVVAGRDPAECAAGYPHGPVSIADLTAEAESFIREQYDSWRTHRTSAST